ncbi:Uncharacterised protein [Vibrio cholerae]|uniref:Uncharacterized protein n=1 Tax=Vibrio cholerae TaxID=666 RepID=A0A655ZT96_VIBCL|nr:Uncharacterised protein [Vibrio cholerae]CSB39044.1 Uncharacterised protein [Vibrio cholerae]CSB83150.1 Uncharacterised protein [Vibrio cholerae]CSC78002.1 Uncharacterised protein [Vibrio cholerae]CSC89458.1 Uncharacterised protein [Vibrio cholerae]
MQHLIVHLLPLSFNRINLLLGWVVQLLHFGLPAATQYDIRTTTRHVSCDGDCARFTGFSNNFRFFFMELRVQNIVLDACFFQCIGEQF